MKSLTMSIAVAALLVILVASSAPAADWEVWVVTLKGTAADYNGQRFKYAEYDTLLVSSDTMPLSVVMLDAEDNVMWEGVGDGGAKCMNYTGTSAGGEDVAVGYMRFAKNLMKFSGKQYEWYWDGVIGWHIQMTSKGYFDSFITLREDLSDLKPALAALKASKPAEAAAGLEGAAGDDMPAELLQAIRTRARRHVTLTKGSVTP